MSEVTSTAVTAVKLSALNTEAEFALTAATETTADAAEEMVLSAIGPRALILIKNGAADQGAVAWDIEAGDFWAGVKKSGSVAQGKTEVIMVETAKHKKSDGKVVITLTPADGKKLATNHAAAVGCVILP